MIYLLVFIHQKQASFQKEVVRVLITFRQKFITVQDKFCFFRRNMIISSMNINYFIQRFDDEKYLF